MCDFCHKHGEGKKWYLEAKNYSMDLARDAERKNFIEEFIPQILAQGQEIPERLKKLNQAPRIVRWFIRRRTSKKMKGMHFGQIVPIEDVEAILNITNSIVRIPCICRKTLLGKAPAYCMAISTDPIVFKAPFEQLELLAKDNKSISGPEVSGLEKLSKEEALTLLREFEKDGMVHSIWTFKTPFIGGLCNCDRAGCLAMKSLESRLNMFFRAEYLAEVDSTACTGCRNCLKQCQFGAMYFNPTERKAGIDAARCFGCGICRVTCAQKAINLVPRTAGFEAVPS